MKLEGIFLFGVLMGLNLSAKAQTIEHSSQWPWVNNVQGFIDGFNRQDYKEMSAFMETDIQWDQQGDNRVSGLKSGALAVLNMIRSMYKLSDQTLKITAIKSMTYHNHTVACALHLNGSQPPGGILDVDEILIFEFGTNKIKKVTVYSADIETEDHFWGEIY